MATHILHPRHPDHPAQTADPGAVAAETTGPPERGTEPTPAVADASGIADPAALGLAAFAMTTMVLSIVNTGLVGAAAAPVVLGLALVYGGAAQLLAGMWEFLRGNTFGALAFSSYGAFWISYWVYANFLLPGITRAGEARAATGLFLAVWAFFTGYMVIAALRVSMAVLGVFVLLFATYVVLAVGAYGDYALVTKIGGWVGVATAAVAWYTSFAVVTNSTFRRTVLPVGPLA
jgi:hypothetical protein